MKAIALILTGLLISPHAVPAGGGVEPPVAEASPVIVLAADQWCPINCIPDSDRPGFMIEIAQEIFSEAGYRVDYQLMPWSRAIVSGREGNVDGIVGAYVGDAPDFIFPEEEQGRIAPSALFTLAASDWTYTGPESLEAIQLGTILDYDYGKEINRYVAAHAQSYRVQVMTGNSPLEKNIEKLLMGRIDVVVEAEPVFRYKAREMKVEDMVRYAGAVSPRDDAYIAFSPSIPEAHHYARLLSQGMENLRASGELQEIMARYGLEDWQ